MGNSNFINELVEVVAKVEKEERLIKFEKQLTKIINKNSIDSLVNKPDFIISEILIGKIKELMEVDNGK